MPDDVSRRTLLRSGTAATGLGVTGWLAGCSAVTDRLNDDDGEPTEPTTETDSSPPSYQQWLPAPSAYDGLDHYYFEYQDYAAIRDNEANFDDDVYRRFEDRVSIFDIVAEDVETAIAVEAATGSNDPSVLLGEFDVDELASTLTEQGFEAVRDIGDYTAYRLAEDETAVAVKSDTVLVGGGGRSVEKIEPLIDTSNGATDTYTAASADMRTLLDNFGDGTFVFGETQEPVTETDVQRAEIAGQVGYGYEDRVEGESTVTEIVFLFETESDVDMDAVSEYTDQDFFVDYGNLTSTQAGRAAIVTGEIDTDDLYAWS